MPARLTRPLTICLTMISIASCASTSVAPESERDYKLWVCGRYSSIELDAGAETRLTHAEKKQVVDFNSKRDQDCR